MSAVEITADVRGGTLRGAIYVLAAGLCWSFTGIFLRLAPHFDPLNLWQTASIALGLAGLLIIVGGGLRAGSLIGNVCAIATAFGFAGASVAMRRGHVRDFSPAIFGYGLIACTFSALVCLGEGVSLVSPLADVVAALAGGLLPMGLGFAYRSYCEVC